MPQWGKKHLWEGQHTLGFCDGARRAVSTDSSHFIQESLLCVPARHMGGGKKDVAIAGSVDMSLHKHESSYMKAARAAPLSSVINIHLFILPLAQNPV